jgi:hypothetical protein
MRAVHWVAAAVVACAAAWAGLTAVAQDAKPADLSALREAVDAAAKRGDNVDEIQTALAALEKAKPTAAAGRVPAELQALRNAVDAAAKKGENVDVIAKELAAVETAVTGKSLAKPVTEPPPPVDPTRPNPIRPIVPFPQPFPVMPNPRAGGVDIEMFNKAMEMRRKAIEAMVKSPNDEALRKEMQKLVAEANELLLKAARGANPDPVLPLPLPLPVVPPDFPAFPNFPDVGRLPERARLGIRLERVPAVVVDQLGLEAGVGIAVTMVTPNSVAEKVGLKVHDIIVEFAGKPVTDNTDDFIRRVNAVKAGEKIDIVVLRKGKKIEVKGVELPAVAQPRAQPPFPALPLPGLLPELPNGRDLPPIAPPVPPLNPLPAPIPPIGDLPVEVRAFADPVVDLGDLKDAIAAAEKRGENVTAIREAAEKLDKALAKGAKAGEAPPELTAVRDAVEAAAKKGESVERISDELGKVEKALTGRAFERPKAVDPPRPVRPEPPPFRGGGRIVIGGGGRVVIGGNGGFNATSVSISNGMFTVRARQGDILYTITGSTTGTEAPKIIIKDGDKTTETDDPKKVPEAYRPTVERLLGMVQRG